MEEQLVLDKQFYENLFTVDFNVDNCKDRYVVDLSFTFLHWNLIELLAKGRIQVDQIDQEQLECMCYNILPGGENFAHKLEEKSDVLQ